MVKQYFTHTLKRVREDSIFVVKSEGPWHSLRSLVLENRRCLVHYPIQNTKISIICWQIKQSAYQAIQKIYLLLVKKLSKIWTCQGYSFFDRILRGYVSIYEDTCNYGNKTTNTILYIFVCLLQTKVQTHKHNARCYLDVNDVLDVLRHYRSVCEEWRYQSRGKHILDSG